MSTCACWAGAGHALWLCPAPRRSREHGPPCSGSTATVTSWVGPASPLLGCVGSSRARAAQLTSSARRCGEAKGHAAGGAHGGSPPAAQGAGGWWFAPQAHLVRTSWFAPVRALVRTLHICNRYVTMREPLPGAAGGLRELREPGARFAHLNMCQLGNIWCPGASCGARRAPPVHCAP
jgi:hypothetical protein